ncbi:ATP-binding protein [Nocardia sp. SYP-A9097]|uniref:AlbA family DNA-binding domain-containing protein n=1 Tax=Nocardia sp. SYP-A9097 TaxID=2663237 RepID=UPI0028165640|nr:ATP-binding protein [Nocardia sp. SYP-A9097]
MTTTTGPLWDPRTEEDLRAALDHGLLEETHYLDLKRTVDPGKSANRKIAADIASFALDGGTIVIGVDEGADGATLSLWPVELAGLPERIESIAATVVHEPVRISTTRIPAAGKPGQGYLVVRILQSPRAPHMVEGRYYGRGDKENRVLSQEEVLRLHERRLAGRTDILAETHRAIEELGPRGNTSILVILAEPIGAPDDLLVPLTESGSWQSTVLSLVQQAALSEHREYAPTLAEAGSFGRRANAVAITTGMHDGARFEAGTNRAAEIAFHENGSLLLASERAVEIQTFPHVNPTTPDVEVVFETLILGHTLLMMRLAALVSQTFGFSGTWRIGLVVTGLRGTRSFTLCARRFGHDGAVYTADSYQRATEATLLDLTAEPRTVVKALVAPLLRSLDAHHAWETYFTEPADDGG